MKNRISFTTIGIHTFLRPTIDVECTVIETKPLNLYMQPSEIHNRQELQRCIEAQKVLTGEDKKRCTARIHELERALGIVLKKEKESIATDEHEEN